MKTGIQAIKAAVLSLGSLIAEAYRGAPATGQATRKRKHGHKTRMARSEGGRRDKVARAHRPGTVEKLGFRRSDVRHPKHVLHTATHHPDSECNCVGKGHPREALKPVVAMEDAA